jgi:hypothetical protein
VSQGNGDAEPEKKVGRDDTATAKSLQRMAKALHETLNPMHDSGHASTGFCLLVFGFNAPGIANYVSNANRKDMIKAMKETIKRLEDNEDNVRYGDDVLTE